MVSEVFLSLLLTSTIGCVLGVVNILYKSKCTEVGLCCLTIKRDVQVEEHEDIEIMRHKSSNVEESKD